MGFLMSTVTSDTAENKNRHGEHLLISLTYIAKNTQLNTGIELTRALEHWRRYFEDSGITSVLVISDGYFIQNIQGSRPAINDALARIISEYFDISPHVIKVEEIEARRWGGFAMKHLTSSAEDEEYTLKSFSAGADFNPYLMKSSQITSFLKAIFEEKSMPS